jgi:hypothetical protein
MLMEDRHQKSKGLLYMAKFKHEVVRCAEVTGKHEAPAIAGADKNVQLGGKLKVAIRD